MALREIDGLAEPTLHPLDASGAIVHGPREMDRVPEQHFDRAEQLDAELQHSSEDPVFLSVEFGVFRIAHQLQVIPDASADPLPAGFQPGERELVLKGNFIHQRQRRNVLVVVLIGLLRLLKVFCALPRVRILMGKERGHGLLSGQAAPARAICGSGQGLLLLLVKQVRPGFGLSVPEGFTSSKNILGRMTGGAPRSWQRASRPHAPRGDARVGRSASRL